MMLYEKISDRLYSDLLNAILIGDFPQHSTLPTEQILARDYGISRSTVRVALTQLKSEGFIVSRQGAGTVVADFNNDKTTPFVSDESLLDLEKCFECRIVIEPEIAAIVSRRRSPQDMVYFRQHITAMASLIKSRGTYTSEDTDFHFRLAGLSGNKFFESIMTFLRPHILLGMNLIKTIPEEDRENHARQSLREHKKIVTALTAGDSAKARISMRNHLKFSRRRIFERN